MEDYCTKIWMKRIFFILLGVGMMAIIQMSSHIDFFSHGYHSNISNWIPNRTGRPQHTADWQTRDTQDISCKKIVAGDADEIKRANVIMTKEFRSSFLPEIYPALTSDCGQYRRTRGFINRTMTSGERQFPIAFSILVYKHAEQVERLLRAVWRPHNVYCIHVDSKSSGVFKAAIQSMSKCFNNIIFPPKQVQVKWGTYTVLEPELLCMEALWKHKTGWKYFINLTGQEFPLKTNYELYRALEAYNGTNDIGGGYKGANLGRWKGRGDPPHKIQPRKGGVHIAATREYVDYLLHNNVSRDLLKWVKKTGVPDETYFATLNYNPHLKVPGSYKGDVDDGLHHEMVRYKIWGEQTKCSGKFTRGICIFSVGDLVRMTSSPYLFANKFFYDYHHLAYDCLEAWYRDKVVQELQGRLDFNTTVYSNKRVVTHHF
ncbi:beta-1,3-galactosyl-O-glycosyl-glycoprotein beta-1,6-N-acetylglucosaminyltransferase-like [Haliotis asinina]|uniref:beta-1,3-galactosyl-O-glycosyl-glycoprotein beta-1,6-N-acetylglucosaminyltransferase-like n=1 Tax=Haliotis asinina TaxID=109174 RepID=UPI0035325BBF